ncbi:MAG: hypothetical protein M1546_13950 [Chloroflexi bacterium]|nr:hypothetical protein [Chloroflexota bacterium]
MSKAKHRTGRRPRAEPREQVAPVNPRDAQTPATATFFRTSLVDARMRALMYGALSKFGSLLRAGERDIARQVNDAQTPQDLVRLAAVVKGAAEGEWHKRLEAYGPASVPVIEQRLKTCQSIHDEDERTKTMENLIAALRWQGAAGARALLACFDNLDDYGQSLACVVLGLLRSNLAGDVIWRYFQRVRKSDESYFVGALWGLIDLQDPRAADALDDLWRNGPDFNELYGFMARSGDARAVIPLMAECAAAENQQEREPPFTAFAAVAQRVGREACLAQLSQVGQPTGEQRRIMTQIVDSALAVPRPDIESLFDLFYSGAPPQDAQS